MRKLLVAFCLVASAISQSGAQTPVKQSGSITPGHAVRWIANGTIADAGTATQSFLSSIGVTGGPICVNTAPITQAYNQLCLQATTSGSAVISYNAFGGASSGGITFNVNGSVQGFLTATLPVTAGDSACFADTSGNIQSCGIVPATVTSISAGTGISLSPSPITTTGSVSIADTAVTPGAYGSATNCAAFAVDQQGRITTASATTCTPAIGSVTGLGTGVSTWLVTPSSANLAAAVTGETGTGALVFGTAPTFTTSATSPILYGGSAAGSNLALHGTSNGSPSGDSVTIKSGANNLIHFRQNPAGALANTAYLDCWPGNDASGQNAECGVASSNANAGFSFRMKGTGVFVLHGPTDASQAATMCLYEDETNGNDRVCIQAAAAMGASYTMALPATQPISQTLTVRDAAGTGTCTITVVSGMITASTC